MLKRKKTGWWSLIVDQVMAKKLSDEEAEDEIREAFKVFDGVGCKEMLMLRFFFVFHVHGVSLKTEFLYATYFTGFHR